MTRPRDAALDDGDPGWFLMPSECVDEHVLAAIGGVQGLFVLAMVSACNTRAEYPTAEEIGKRARLYPHVVKSLVKKLVAHGLLNSSDERALCVTVKS